MAGEVKSTGKIHGFFGPEGAGKSCVMTAIILEHIKHGAEVYTFPGYEITDGKSSVLSKELKPEQLPTLLDDLDGKVLAIDELQNFFDKRRWNTVLSRIFDMLNIQRRKRDFSFLYTCQNWAWVPTRLQYLTHFYTECYDLYWRYKRSKKHRLARGTVISLVDYDCKGFETGHEWSRGRPKRFYAKPYWKHYNSYGTVDIFSAWDKFRVHGREIDIYVGDNGMEYDMNNFNPELIGSEIAGASSNIADPTPVISMVINEIRNSGVKELATKEVQQIIANQGINMHPTKLGRIITELGVFSKQVKRNGRSYLAYQFK